MSESRHRPRILFLGHLLPWPRTGGGQIKSYYTLKRLSSRYEVTLLAFVRQKEEQTSENLATLKAICNDVWTVHLPRSRFRDAAAAARALQTGRCFLIDRDDSAMMRKQVRSLLEAKRYDAIHVDHLQMMQFVPSDLPADNVKIILDEHNVEYTLASRLIGILGDNSLSRAFSEGEGEKLRIFEIDACRRADRVLAVSEADCAALAALDPSLESKIVVTPIGVDLDYWRPAKRELDAGDLLSIGTMDWQPNVEGLRWFHAEILPHIRATFPHIRLNIVGARPALAICALAAADPQTVVTGLVPDVRVSARTCGVFIVPLLSGSGVRVKLLNALAMGLPVVSTTLGAEGIDLDDGVHLLLADTPEAFAAAVLRLLHDSELAARLGAAGRERIKTRYSWDVAARNLLATYDALFIDKETAF